MRYRREDFPSQTKNIVIEFPELCEAASTDDIAALKATVAMHNEAVDAKLKDPTVPPNRTEKEPTA